MLFSKNKQTVNIEGMSCEHCAKTVESKIKTIDGVKKVKANLNKKCVIITSNEPIKKEDISSVLEDTKFKVI